MFYPTACLKRGGRFHLCWVADAWPMVFDTISRRELWSKDIRTICDELLEKVTESGPPSNTSRFSLRLSSQLMRGLVRLYQKKVSILLEDMCMIHASITKWDFNEIQIDIIAQPLLLPEQLAIQEVENEDNIQEIQTIRNYTVGDLSLITLEESFRPVKELPIDDNEDEALQMLVSRTVEEVLVDEASVACSYTERSGPDVTPPESPQPPGHDIELMDMSMSSQSTAVEDILMAEIEKDVPEIPDILPLETPAQSPVPQAVENLNQAEVPSVSSAGDENEEIVLEELEDKELEELGRRRRQKKVKIFDKKTMLPEPSTHNPQVHLRCQSSSNDAYTFRVPAAEYFRFPSHTGLCRGSLGAPLMRLFPHFQRKVLKPRRKQLAPPTNMEVTVEEPVAGPSPSPRFSIDQPEAGTDSVLEFTDFPNEVTPKTRQIGVISFKSQQAAADPEDPETATDKSISAMLQEAGLAAESSESLLGSLDRTAVSLGETERTTGGTGAREQWDTESTMVEIMRAVRAEQRPLTVRELLARGPAVHGPRAIAAAKCFSSILKLKQHGFVRIQKDPDSSEIQNITLGPKFDNVE